MKYARRFLVCIVTLLALESAGLAQTPSATTYERDLQRCLKSTCRNVPLRERLSVIGNRNWRAIVGGFEQGSGIGGGAQLSSKDLIPDVEFRANFLASSKLSRRTDLEAFIPRAGSTKNHI